MIDPNYPPGCSAADYEAWAGLDSEDAGEETCDCHGELLNNRGDCPYTDYCLDCDLSLEECECEESYD